jgi:diguanylate cyclase (GGDEF)-like protein
MEPQKNGVSPAGEVRGGIGIEAERARRYEAHLSVLLINLDGLGRVNDRLGREAGDRLLAGVADLIRANTRLIDVFGRWDMEDFIILSVDRNADGSRTMAEKLRRLIDQYSLDFGGQEVRVTACIGVARGVPASEGEIDGLLERARAAVLTAKSQGRNRVVYADPCTTDA